MKKILILLSFLNGLISTLSSPELRTSTNRNVRQRKYSNITSLQNTTWSDLHFTSSIPLGSNLIYPSSFCPIGRAEKKVYQIPPYANMLTEVSYMAHSSQLYENKSVVVW